MFESIGQQLKKEREARFLTLEKASAATRIRTVFLQALEADDYSVMPSAAQGRGFLRNYAEYLELNIDEMIAEMQRNASPPTEVSGPLPQVNLVETEIPPLAPEEDEPTQNLSWVGKARFALTSWLGLRSKPAPLAQIDSDAAEPMAEIKPSDVEEAPPQQMEAESPPNFLSQLNFFLRSFFLKKESQPAPKLPPMVEPEIPHFVPAQPADIIFVEIGAQLRERRELISLTFDEVERHTKLRAAFVKALEEGAFDKLPSPVQTRGMLANYAAFLDLDTDTILLRFADGLQARRYEKYAETPREKIQTEVITSIPLLRSFMAGDLIFGVMMIAILFALAIWGVGRVVSSQGAQNAEATAPSIVDVLGSTPLPTASLSATYIAVDENLTATPAANDNAPIEPNANVVVDVFALERVFTRISVDGEVVFEGRLAPGTTKVFEANDQVLVLTGNAAAMRITYNGRDLGLMGNTGEVVSRVYLISGIATPTATISPTPTNTQPVTDTPTTTMTPSATPLNGG